MGPSAGLDECGKSRPHRDSIPGPSNPQRVAVLTELPGPKVRWRKNVILWMNGDELIIIIIIIN